MTDALAHRQGELKIYPNVYNMACECKFSHSSKIVVSTALKLISSAIAKHY